MQHTVQFLCDRWASHCGTSLQCESKKNPPLRFSEIFSQTVGNF